VTEQILTRLLPIEWANPWILVTRPIEMRKKLCENRDGERSLANTLFAGATSSLHGELESRLPNFAPEVEIDRQGGPDNVCFAPRGESQVRNVVSMQGHLGYRDRIYRAAY
jgi:hypothetical protein